MKPDHITMDAVELYQLVVRTLAVFSVTGSDARAKAQSWLATAGMDEAEREAVRLLFENAVRS
jgi:hypothetical protein